MGVEWLRREDGFRLGTAQERSQLSRLLVGGRNKNTTFNHGRSHHDQATSPTPSTNQQAS